MNQADEEAFACFVHARSAALLATAWGLTRDRQLAEDLVQTALARCYVAWPRIKSDEPEAYVRRAMINAQKNVWRRRLPRLTWRAQVPEEAASTSFDSELVERRSLLDAVATLSPQQRAVIVYRYYEDRTDAQIAVLLGCSVGSVKRHANRALRRLEAHPSLRDFGASSRMTTRAVT